MNFADLITSANHNLWRNKGRTILTIIAIFVGSFTISLTSAVNIGVNDYIDRQIGIFGTDNSTLEISAKQGTEDLTSIDEPIEYSPESASTSIGGMNYKMLSSQDIEDISKLEGIEEARGWGLTAIEYVEGTNGKKFNLDASSVYEGMVLDTRSGQPVSTESDQYEINLPLGYVQALGYDNDEQAIDQKITIAVRNQVDGQVKTTEATIIGILNKSLLQSMSGFYTQNLQDKLYDLQTSGLPDSMKNTFMAATAKTKEGADIEAIKAELNKMGFAAQTVEDAIGSVRNIINAITGALVMFGAIALLAASFGIINTLFMSVQERTREIGLFKAMGMSSGKVFAMFSFEAVLIGFWGSILGYGVAILAGSLINGFARETFLAGLDGFELTIFTPAMGLAVCAVIMSIAFLAGTLPSRRASKQNPIKALRYE